MSGKNCIWSLIHKKNCMSTLQGKDLKSLLHAHVTRGVCWDVIGTSGIVFLTYKQWINFNINRWTTTQNMSNMWEAVHWKGRNKGAL